MITLSDLYGIPGAIEFLYELMKERERDPQMNISHRGLPTFEQHQAFVEGRPYRLWYLINMPVGYISATHSNEIGIVLRRDWRGHGIGPQAIRQLLAMHDPLPAGPSVRNGHWLANISPANEHSKHTFEKLGFHKIQETYAFNEEERHDSRIEESTVAST